MRSLDKSIFFYISYIRILFENIIDKDIIKNNNNKKIHVISWRIFIACRSNIDRSVGRYYNIPLNQLVIIIIFYFKYNNRITRLLYYARMINPLVILDRLDGILFLNHRGIPVYRYTYPSYCVRLNLIRRSSSVCCFFRTVRNRYRNVSDGNENTHFVFVFDGRSAGPRISPELQRLYVCRRSRLSGSFDQFLFIHQVIVIM